jgi:hypothetical protein
MMAYTTCKKKKEKKTFLILTGVFCTVGGTLVLESNGIISSITVESV